MKIIKTECGTYLHADDLIEWLTQNREDLLADGYTGTVKTVDEIVSGIEIWSAEGEA